MTTMLEIRYVTRLWLGYKPEPEVREWVLTKTDTQPKVMKVESEKLTYTAPVEHP